MFFCGFLRISYRSPIDFLYVFYVFNGLLQYLYDFLWLSILHSPQYNLYDFIYFYYLFMYFMYFIEIKGKYFLCDSEFWRGAGVADLGGA